MKYMLLIFAIAFCCLADKLDRKQWRGYIIQKVSTKDTVHCVRVSWYQGFKRDYSDLRVTCGLEDSIIIDSICEPDADFTNVCFKYNGTKVKIWYGNKVAVQIDKAALREELESSKPKIDDLGTGGPVIIGEDPIELPPETPVEEKPLIETWQEANPTKYAPTLIDTTKRIPSHCKCGGY
jgi:hypothetical protein